MLIKILLAHSVFALGLAAPFSTYTRCANQYNATEVQASEAQFIHDLAAAETAGSLQPNQESKFPFPICLVVKVVWHIIHESMAVEGGYMSDQAVIDSINAMNTHFTGTTTKLFLDRITRTENKEWFDKVDIDSPFQDAMKKQLHVGDATVLNIYSVGFTTLGNLGYSPYPNGYAANPWHDGVVIKHDTVPGGSAGSYNEGKTLTHEVGHWLGLYHVFNEEKPPRCIDRDMVNDTPVQSQATRGCPATQDSCPDQPGEDSIHNYMDYSDDRCLTEFTPGQIGRMRIQSDVYRKFPRKLCFVFPTTIWTGRAFPRTPAATPISTPNIPRDSIPDPGPCTFP